MKQKPFIEYDDQKLTLNLRCRYFDQDFRFDPMGARKVSVVFPLLGGKVEDGETAKVVIVKHVLVLVQT